MCTSSVFFSEHPLDPDSGLYIGQASSEKNQVNLNPVQITELCMRPFLFLSSLSPCRLIHFADSQASCFHQRLGGCPPPPTSSARLFMKSHLALMFWLRSRSMHNLWIVVVLLCSTCVDLPDLPRAQCQPRPVLSTSISDVDVHSPLTRQHVAVCLTLWVFRDVRSGMSHDAHDA